MSLVSVRPSVSCPLYNLTTIWNILMMLHLCRAGHDDVSRTKMGGGRVVRWCWVNFQCRGVLLIWIIVGQGPSALVVGAGGGCLDIFSLIYHFSFLSSSLCETARYRLEYCPKGSLNPKQPTNQNRTKMRALALKLFQLSPL